MSATRTRRAAPWVLLAAGVLVVVVAGRGEGQGGPAGSPLSTGPDGTREVPVENFCTAPGRTVLGHGEFLVSLHLPPPQPRSGASYLRFIPRNEMDIAVVGAGVRVTLCWCSATDWATAATPPSSTGRDGAAPWWSPMSDRA